MIKRNVTVLIMIFAALGAAFTQTNINVYLNEYEVSPENSVFANEDIILSNVFFNRLRELDMSNGYLTIIAAHLIPEKISESAYSESDYIINGRITQYKDDMYNISTLLLRNRMPVLPIDSVREHVDLPKLQDIIRKHAEEIYKEFERISNNEGKCGDMQQQLAVFDKDYKQKINSMDITESNQALQRLARLEDEFGKSDEINNRRHEIANNSAIAVSLSKAEEKINRAFDRQISDDESTSFCKEAEIYALQVRRLIEQSGDPRLLAKLESVERKIDEYWKSYFAVYTEGLELFIEKPLLMLLTSSAGFDLQKAYPGILGVNLRYNGPTMLPLQWYVHLSYAGINGGIKENDVAYLKDAAIHYFSLSTGMNLQFYVNKIIAPYGYYGLGYIHLFEYASDGRDSITLNFPGMVMDVGAGSRFHFNQHFALNAMVQWNLMVTEAMLMDVKFSLGVSYMFSGKEYFLRRWSGRGRYE